MDAYYSRTSKVEAFGLCAVTNPGLTVQYIFICIWLGPCGMMNSFIVYNMEAAKIEKWPAVVTILKNLNFDVGLYFDRKKVYDAYMDYIKPAIYDPSRGIVKRQHISLQHLPHNPGEMSTNNIKAQSTLDRLLITSTSDANVENEDSSDIDTDTDTEGTRSTKRKSKKVEHYADEQAENDTKRKKPRRTSRSKIHDQSSVKQTSSTIENTESVLVSASRTSDYEPVNFLIFNLIYFSIAFFIHIFSALKMRTNQLKLTFMKRYN